MKAKIKLLLLLPLVTLFMFTSCQKEVVDVTEPTEQEAIKADSELAKLVESTAKLDGSKDNILDNSSCYSVQLPVKVKVGGIVIEIQSEEDFKKIQSYFHELNIDRLDFFFPITILSSDYEPVIIENPNQLVELINGCQGEDEEDDDIECIDFQYPISFSVYDGDFQVSNIVTINGDEALHRFIHRVRNSEVFASLNFPVSMELADGTEVEVKNNAELERTIRDAKTICEEDDDNNYGDNDFSIEGLNEYLTSCPWLVYDFFRNEEDLSLRYKEYGLKFMLNHVVMMKKPNGDLLQGFWNVRVTPNGVLLELEFAGFPEFTFEWLVFDVEYGVLELFKYGGNKIIMKRNCEVDIEQPINPVIENLLECYWRVGYIHVNGADHTSDYIGTPLKFFPDNVVKMRINGEDIEGTYKVYPAPGSLDDFIMKIMLPNRPNLQLEWYVMNYGEDTIKLSNQSGEIVLNKHCPMEDEDINFVDNILQDGDWRGYLYVTDGEAIPQQFSSYSINFTQTGKVIVTDPNNGVFVATWLVYRNEGLNLALHFGENIPFNQLTHRWKIAEITANKIVLKDYNSQGGVERTLELLKGWEMD